jgi:hypothetical protein
MFILSGHTNADINSTLEAAAKFFMFSASLTSNRQNLFGEIILAVINVYI